MKTSQLLKAGALAAALATAGLAQAEPVNLLTNGSFEYPGVANGTWVHDGSLRNDPAFGWQYAAGEVIEIRNNAVGTAQHGSNYVELDSTHNMSIWQDIATTAGQAYQVSFWYSPRIGQPDSTNGIGAYWNGTLLTDPYITANGGASNTWTLYTFNVIADGSSSTLKFSAGGTSDSYGGNIDNVAVSTVPLPGAALMFGSALLGSGALRRRQQQKTAGAQAA